MARLFGEPTERVLEECHSCVLEMAAEKGCSSVLYDLRKMEAAPLKVLLYQRILDSQLGRVELRRAVVVPNVRLGHLARLAFGDREYRLFYDDMEAATKCLSEDRAAVHEVWRTTVREERRIRERRTSGHRKLSGRRRSDAAVSLAR